VCLIQSPETSLIFKIFPKYKHTFSPTDKSLKDPPLYTWGTFIGNHSRIAHSTSSLQRYQIRWNAWEVDGSAMMRKWKWLLANCCRPNSLKEIQNPVQLGKNPPACCRIILKIIMTLWRKWTNFTFEFYIIWFFWPRERLPCDKRVSYIKRFERTKKYTRNCIFKKNYIHLINARNM
jgi:hypothetical protein